MGFELNHSTDCEIGLMFDTLLEYRLVHLNFEVAMRQTLATLLTKQITQLL